MKTLALRIAIIGCRGIPARWGGYEAFMEELAPRLAARGHDVTVYCRAEYSDPDQPTEFRGVKLIYTPYIRGKLLETGSHEILSALHALFRPFDIYYILGCRTSWIYVIHRLLRRRLVFQTDGLDWERRKWGPGMRKYLRLSYWIAMRLANRIASDSRSVCDFYVREYGIGAEYLTCGAQPIVRARQEVLEEYKLIPDSYFLVVCRIEPENNVDLIVRAFEGLDTDKKLVVVGGVNYRSSYFRKLRETRDPRVIFTGPVYTLGHVDALCSYCFAYIDGHEVGGTSPGLLRAMASGACVFALNRPFNAEVVGDAGVLWEKSSDSLRTRMVRLLLDSECVALYRKRAVARIVERYGWEGVTDAHERCFARVFGEHRNAQ